MTNKTAAVKDNTANETATTKPNLAESQRNGAIERADAAGKRADAALAGLPEASEFIDIVNAAHADAQKFVFEAKSAGGTADAQYASRKADEAATATAWLVSYARR